MNTYTAVNTSDLVVAMRGPRTGIALSHAYSFCPCSGLPTQRRFYPGGDAWLYPQLLRAMAEGDRLAALVYRFVFKNTRRSTFPWQRRLIRLWLERRGIQRWDPMCTSELAPQRQSRRQCAGGDRARANATSCAETRTVIYSK